MKYEEAQYNKAMEAYDVLRKLETSLHVLEGVEVAPQITVLKTHLENQVKKWHGMVLYTKEEGK